jgi:hypothetical protein
MKAMELAVISRGRCCNSDFTHDPLAGEIADYNSIVFIQNCQVVILQERSSLKRLEDLSAPYPTLQN